MAEDRDVEKLVQTVRSLEREFKDMTDEQQMIVRSALAQVPNPSETYTIGDAPLDLEARRKANRVAAERIQKYVELDARWLGRPRGLWELCHLVAEDLHISIDYARAGAHILEGFDIDLLEGTIRRLQPVSI